MLSTLIIIGKYFHKLLLNKIKSTKLTEVQQLLKVSLSLQVERNVQKLLIVIQKSLRIIVRIIVRKIVRQLLEKIFFKLEKIFLELEKLS